MPTKKSAVAAIAETVKVAAAEVGLIDPTPEPKAPRAVRKAVRKTRIAQAEKEKLIVRQERVARMAPAAKVKQAD